MNAHVQDRATRFWFVWLVGLDSFRLKLGLPKYKALQWNIQELVTMVNYREHPQQAGQSRNCSAGRQGHLKRYVGQICKCPFFRAFLPPQHEREMVPHC